PSSPAGGRGTLARIAARLPHLSVAGMARPGRNASEAVREITVVRGGETLGTLEVAVPFDRRLVRRIEARAAASAGDRVAVFAGGRLVSRDATIAGRLSARPPTASRVRLRGRVYRALSAGLPGGGSARLAVLTPEQAIDAA